MNIALKECSEASYWLELLSATRYIDPLKYKPLLDDCIELNKMLIAIVKTTKEKLNMS